MARDLRGNRQVASPPRPGFFLQASRSLPHPRETPPVAAKASPSSAPDPGPPASLRAPLNTATPPTSEPLPARIVRLIACGNRREGTVLPPAGELRERVSPFPAAPLILPAIAAPSVPFPSTL